MGSAYKAFSGIAWSIVVNVVNAVYGFIATPLLINYFGRSEYGIIALATSVNAYMGLMDMGLSSTNVRFFSNWMAKGDTDKVEKLMQTCTAFYAVIGIINALVLIIVSLFSDSIFNVTPAQDICLKQMLWILSVTAIINWYTSCFGQIISATENVAWVQKRTLVTKVFMIIAVVLTFTLKFSIVQYFIAVTVAGFIVLPATIQKIRKEVPYVSFLAKFDKQTFKTILPYTLNIFSFGIFQFSYKNLRNVILGIQGTITAVTDNGVMSSIASLVTMVGGVFISALLPASSRIVAQGDTDNYYRIAYRGTHFVTIVITFCVFGLITVDRDLMMVYVGKDFMNLIPWLNMLLILSLFGNVSCISSLILAGSDIRPLTYSSCIASVAGIVACWFTTPYFQAGGVVVSMLVYDAIQEIFYYTYYWPRMLKINSLRIFLHTDLPFWALGGTLTFGLTSLPHFSNHWTNIFVFGVAFAIIYLIVTYCILNKEDKDFIFGLIKFRRK